VSAAAVIEAAQPFDLALSLRAAASFLPVQGAVPPVLKAGLHLDGHPVVIEIHQGCKLPHEITAITSAPLDTARLGAIAGRILSADLDLRPFYALGAGHPVLGPVMTALHGVKPLRPPLLFEMLIIAITEQQLSLAAAFHIRHRLVARFGVERDGVWIFPTPAALAAASLSDLAACGLSRRKAEYVRDLATETAAGRLDLERFEDMAEAEIRSMLERQRGLGAWSIAYFLARGLGRPDCLPASDIGLRRVVGRYLCGGRRLSPEELEGALAPFAPFRSLAAYYLAVHARLAPAQTNRGGAEREATERGLG
jgi:3-methyladenine DNA glycosylase/8-oxoguanine DNA glycosylase